MTSSENRSPLAKLVWLAVILIVALIFGMQLVRYKSIAGNEIGVKETWGGVEPKVYPPGMHWLVPAWTQKIIAYDASSQVFVMNNKTHAEEKTANGRETDAYLVQSQEGQDMTISMNLRWRINPAKIISIHTTVRHDIEEKLIRPVLMRVVKDEATRMKAIEAYSGEGLVRLQTSIQHDLQGAGEGAELVERGVIVENFVIEHIALDPKYIEEIKGKQIATQKTLRSIEEQRAGEAQALVAKALAQADANTKIVEAERQKSVTILAAEAENQKAIIAAKAEQQKRILEAEGQRDADIAKAKGVIAMGEAEAQASKLKFAAYSAPGAELYSRIQIAGSMANAFQNIKGYLPQDMKINLLGGNFMDLIEKVVADKSTKVSGLSIPSITTASK